MSLGIHRCWKDYFVSDIGVLKPSKHYQENEVLEKPVKVLDVAGGTGDISFRILEKHREDRIHIGAMGFRLIIYENNGFFKKFHQVLISHVWISMNQCLKMENKERKLLDIMKMVFYKKNSFFCQLSIFIK